MWTTRDRSACASAQSDQRLCCLLLRQYNICCYVWNFKTLASFCSRPGWFESYLVSNLQRQVFSWCGSIFTLSFACPLKHFVQIPYEGQSWFVCYLSFDVGNGKYQQVWAASWQKQQNGCVPSEDSVQPGQLPSLIIVFIVHSMGSYGPKLSSCWQQRLWSDWADVQGGLSLRWVHSHFVGFALRWLIYLLCTVSFYWYLWSMVVTFLGHFH